MAFHNEVEIRGGNEVDPPASQNSRSADSPGENTGSAMDALVELMPWYYYGRETWKLRLRAFSVLK